MNFSERQSAKKSRRTLWTGLFLVLLCWGGLSPAVLRAEEWMFRRSYYTHVLPPEHLEQFPPPERRTAYRPAFAGTTPGFAIRGVYRYNRITLGRGRQTDTTIYRQNWFELEP